MIRFLKEVLTANIDGSQEEQLSLDLSLDLEQFVRGGEIVVGASHGHHLGAREEYQVVLCHSLKLTFEVLG